MKCKYCGKNLIEGAKYCVYCAKPVDERKTNNDNFQEKKTTRKNNPIVVIILIVLLFIIIFGGGFFVYKKYIEKPNKQLDNSKNTVVQEPTKEEKQIPKISKDDVKSLIDKYYFVGAAPDNNLFTVTIDENARKTIALRNIQDDTTKVSCDQIEGYNIVNGVCTNGKDKITEGRTIDYDKLNNKYKYLFGKSNEIGKESIEDLNYIANWEYKADKNLFLETLLISGLEGSPYYTIYAVNDFKQEGDKLIVDVRYVFMKAKDVNGVLLLTTTIGTEEVSYTEEETKKPTFEADFLIKYLWSLDSYEFTFKYEDDHYVFESMTKK